MRYTLTLLSATLLALLGCRAQPETPVATAIAREDIPQLERLLTQGADPNQTDSRGGTPLMWAARNGDIDAIARLLRAGADPNARDNANGWNVLMHAIHKNQRGSLRALLDAGADPNGKTTTGFNALIMAAGYGYADMVRLLLERGADPWAESAGGVTALAVAVGGVSDIDRFTLGDCQTETVQVLLAAAPDLKLKDSFAQRMALRLARWGNCSEVVRAVTRQ